MALVIEKSPARCCWCHEPLKRLVYDGQDPRPWMCNTPTCWARVFPWAITTNKTKRNGTVTDEIDQWHYCPTPKQASFHEACDQIRRAYASAAIVAITGNLNRPSTRVLYGGQAGPGKSHALRFGLYRDCLTYKNLNCLLLRRSFPELEETHLVEMMREQFQIPGLHYKSGERVMEFTATGSRIKAGHCNTEADALAYLSTSYDRIAFDELVTFECDSSLEIMSRARTPMSKRDVYEAGGAQVWAATNPAGRGALWVKQFFIDKSVDYDDYPKYDPSLYAFVDAKLSDNPYLDEGYRTSLEQLPEIRRRQLLEGDWDAFSGQFFDFRAQRDGQPWHVADLEIVA